MSGPRPTAALTVSVLGSVRHRAAARLPAWASGVFKCEYRCVRSAPARPGALLVLRVRGSGFRTEQVLFNSGIGGVPLSKTPLGHSRAYFRRHVWNAAPDADTARQSGAAFLGRRLSGSLTRRLPCTLPGRSLSLLGWKLAEVHQARENVPGGVDANLHLISSSSGLRGEQRGER